MIYIEKNIIKLELGTGKIILYGVPMGFTTYMSIKDNIDYSKLNVIKFADSIENVSISFVKGFINNIFLKIETMDKFHEHFRIEGKPKVVDKFYKALYF